MAEAASLLAAPRDGFTFIETEAALTDCVTALASGHGPIAIDTERASGYRYFGRAYLIQLRRAGAGTFLIDPVAVSTGLAQLAEVLAEPEWILHAATQDLPCLVEAGLVPQRLFDTELAGRLLAYPKVGLGTLTEDVLGLSLAKEHSHVDWSIRPLRDEWLNYAALDVELLAELRTELRDELASAGKLEWLDQECAHLVAHCQDPVIEREDPWRRTSGIQNVHTREGLAALREMWLAREEIAINRDKAPGKIVPDKALAEAAARITASQRRLTRDQLLEVERFRYRQAARYVTTWLSAIDRAAALSAAALPRLRPPQTGLPQVRHWPQLNPEAALWWQELRPLVVAKAEELNIPTENLVSPHLVREFCWEPQDAATHFAVGGARSWQLEFLLPLIEQAGHNISSGEAKIGE